MAAQQDTTFVSLGQPPSEFIAAPAKDPKEPMIKDMSDVSPYLAEFIGTFMLVLTIAYVSFYHQSIFGCTAIGCALMVLVYSLGPVSGGHLNPAVSITLYLLGKFGEGSRTKLPAYIVCQCVGGLFAGFMVKMMFGETLPFGPHEYYHGWQAGMVEVAYTFMLCFVVANCTATSGNKPEDDNNCFFGLAIGFVIIAGAYGGGNISGGCFNPAVSLGMDIPFQCNSWAIFYCLEQLGGALLAVACFKVCRRHEEKERKDEDNQDEEIQEEVKTPSLGSQAISEFLGAFMLVLTVGLNLATGSPGPAWSIAAALTCMIYALGDVSGGHFNPAVTVAIQLAGKDPHSLLEPVYAKKKAAVYIVMQLLGGILASLMYESIHCSLATQDPHFQPIVTSPGAKYTWQQVAVAECLFTSVLAFVVLSVAVYAPKEELEDDGTRTEDGEPIYAKQCECGNEFMDDSLFCRKCGAARKKLPPPRADKSLWLTKHKNHAALAIGLCIVIGGTAIGNVSGGHLNPAVSIGVSTGQSAMCNVDGDTFEHTTPLRWSNCLLFSLFQLGGGVLAAAVYFATHPDDYRF